MAPEHPSSERVVTPSQKQEGYRVVNGMMSERRAWIVLRRLDDGNYLVRTQRGD